MKVKRFFQGSLVLAALCGGSFIWGYTSNKTVQAYEVPVVVKINSAELIERARPELDPGIRQIISAAVDKYSEEYNLDPALVVAVMSRESSFSTTAKSNKECLGLMQINPAAHGEKIKGLQYASLYHINNNVRIGCQILAEYIKGSPSIKQALTKYVGGAHPTYVPDVLSAYAEMMIKRG